MENCCTLYKVHIHFHLNAHWRVGSGGRAPKTSKRHTPFKARVSDVVMQYSQQGTLADKNQDCPERACYMPATLYVRCVILPAWESACYTHHVHERWVFLVS